MGLAKALNGLGRTDELKIVRERSLILAKIRVQLSAVNHSSAGEARTLAQHARKLEMTDAAESFELLARHIERGAG